MPRWWCVKRDSVFSGLSFAMLSEPYSMRGLLLGILFSIFLFPCKYNSVFLSKCHRFDSHYGMAHNCPLLSQTTVLTTRGTLPMQPRRDGGRWCSLSWTALPCTMTQKKWWSTDSSSSWSGTWYQNKKRKKLGRALTHAVPLPVVIPCLPPADLMLAQVSTSA